MVSEGYEGAMGILADITVGSLQQLENIFHITTSAASPPNDYGIVAVIDGSTLVLAPHKKVRG